ncbi:SRPBCC family protein [Nereida sp. MMG025]|uniref:SRPBCC family protein n=1 Tax=Nereida sp. MMG025 TaxID=2909981 RepID=UPI001F1D33B2|nr:SRPBCC family protein [Nereida sp. MMG025]MCF6444299.1 SRPBCC family protein [Nereida sp. MMG025]
MKISVVEDISAPIEYVFARVTNFDAFERGVLRRGAKVRRVEQGAASGDGAKWEVSFMLRGAERRMTVKVAQLDHPTSVVYRTRIKGLVAVVTLDLVALSPSRTRLTLDIKMVSKSLRAKLVIQSLKLAKRRINRKLRKRMGAFAESIEDDFKAVG